MSPRTAVVVPPHGPLTWLFPELLVHDDNRRTQPAESVIDLRDGRDVDDVLATTTDCQLVVEPGPRGTAVVTALTSALRRAGRRDVGVGLGTGPRRDLEHTLLERSTPIAGFPGDTAREVDGVPFFATDLAPGSAPVHTRLAPGWWGVLPGDHWPDDDRERWRQLLLARFPDRALAWLALENKALAGIDLFTESLTRGLRLTRPRAPRGPLVIGVDGIDGAGKSTHLGLLQRWLEQQGLRVTRHKIYRHGVFHDTVTDMTRACRGGRALHLWPLQRHVKLMDSLKYWHTEIAPSLAQADVLLFDRYVETHLAAGSGRFHHDPYAREMLATYPAADVVFVLDLPVETALQRLARREALTVDENPYMLQRFRSQLLELAAARGHVVLDATADLEATQQAIRTAVTTARRLRSGGPR